VVFLQKVFRGVFGLWEREMGNVKLLLGREVTVPDSSGKRTLLDIFLQLVFTLYHSISNFLNFARCFHSFLCKPRLHLLVLHITLFKRSVRKAYTVYWVFYFLCFHFL